MSETRPRRYFVLQFRIFRYLGLGWWHDPEENKTDNFPGWYLYYSIATQIIFVFSFIGLETIDPFFGNSDLDRFMFSLSFVVTHNLTLIKVFIFFMHNAEIQAIVRTLEVEMYDYYQNVAKNRATVWLSKLLTGSFVFFGWLTIANANLYGYIQDRKWKALVANLNDSSVRPVRILPQPVYIPWDYQEDRSYVGAVMVETVGLLWTGHIVLTVDTFIASVILHMSSQFEILNEAITTAYDSTMRTLRQGLHHDAISGIDGESSTNAQEGESSAMDTDENNEKIVQSLIPKEEIEKALHKTFRSCFQQHQVLINCVELFANTYFYGFMIQLLSSVAAICTVMVQVSQDASSFKSAKLATSLAFFAAMIVQLAIQCFSGNELTLQAVRISDAVMDCKWERIPPRQRRLLLMMMMRAQRPLRLTAAGFTYINNECFVATYLYCIHSIYSSSRPLYSKLPFT